MQLNALWWWIDRWRKSSAYMDMTVEEQGAYRNLLDEAHLRRGALPSDERILAKACGDQLIWKRVRDVVMARFEMGDDGCWHHPTLDGVIAESQRRATTQADKGRARAATANREGGRFTSHDTSHGPAAPPAAPPANSPADDQPENQPHHQPPVPVLRSGSGSHSGSGSDSQARTDGKNVSSEPAQNAGSAPPVEPPAMVFATSQPVRIKSRRRSQQRGAAA